MAVVAVSAMWLEWRDWGEARQAPAAASMFERCSFDGRVTYCVKRILRREGG